jgi:sucrose phosphorylase
MEKNPKNRCQLITYPDSLGQTIADVHYVVNRYFSGCFAGIHLLPFYPSSGDRGFAPLTYSSVDSTFGTWEDVDRLGEEYDLMVDFMVNHISRRSEEFKDFEEHGGESKFADLFIRFSAMHPSGDVPKEDLDKVYTRKPRAPFYEVQFPDGSKEKVWCTFDFEQIDINVQSETGLDFLRRCIVTLSRHRVKYLRIDAFGYAVKKLGTNCFCVEPETSELLDEISEIAKTFDCEILPEIHEHHSIQLKLAEQGHYVYDFALPMLCLQALYSHTSKNLKNWLAICPRKQFTTLDTHDGLPVVDVVDLMTEEELEETKENLYSRGANVLKRYSTCASYNNLDIYQINCTYYSALGDNDDAYILARAIQFFTPGIPQVYYVGMLAGRNDIELLEATKLGRNINRHNYSVSEIAEEVRRPVVQRLMNLMRFRNECPAFDGELEIGESPDGELKLTWKHGESQAVLEADLTTYEFSISYTNGGEWARLNYRNS